MAYHVHGASCSDDRGVIAKSRDTNGSEDAPQNESITISFQQLSSSWSSSSVWF